MWHHFGIWSHIRHEISYHLLPSWSTCSRGIGSLTLTQVFCITLWLPVSALPSVLCPIATTVSPYRAPSANGMRILPSALTRLTVLPEFAPTTATSTPLMPIPASSAHKMAIPGLGICELAESHVNWGSPRVSHFLRITDRLALLLAQCLKHFPQKCVKFYTYLEQLCISLPWPKVEGYAHLLNGLILFYE